MKLEIMNKLKVLKFNGTDKNYRLLYKWCNESFIYEWFEQRALTYDEIVKKYKLKIIKNEQKLFLIKYNNKPIGFTQIYKYEDTIYDELKTYNSIYEYDIFIGEKEFLSKGFGTKMINIIDDLIYNDYHADCIVLRPFKRNIRAVKCYQKNGFAIINEYEGTDTLGRKETFQVLINKIGETNDNRIQ